MTDRIEAVTDLIDQVLDGNNQQHTTEPSYGADTGGCWRCGADPADDSPAELCGPCRAFLLEDTDHDPTADTPAASTGLPDLIRERIAAAVPTDLELRASMIADAEMFNRLFPHGEGTGQPRGIIDNSELLWHDITDRVTDIEVTERRSYNLDDFTIESTATECTTGILVGGPGDGRCIPHTPHAYIVPVASFTQYWWNEDEMTIDRIEYRATSEILGGHRVYRPVT